MKKRLAIMAAAVLLICCGAMGVGAASSLTKAQLDATISALPFPLDEVSYSESAIRGRVDDALMNSGKYTRQGGENVWEQYIVVPEADYDAMLFRLFDKAYITSTGWYPDTFRQYGEYDAGAKTYTVRPRGGVGGFGPAKYAYTGFLMENGSYALYFAEQTSEELPRDSGIDPEAQGYPETISYQGKTYECYAGDYYAVTQFDKGALMRFKWNDGVPQYVSSQPVDKLPAAYDAVAKDSTTTEKKPITTTAKPVTTTGKAAGTTTAATAAGATEATTTGSEATATQSTTAAVIELPVVAQTETVTLRAADGVFPAKTTVAVKALDTAELSSELSLSLANVADRFAVYDIKATAEDAPVQPNGTVQATFAIPAGFDPANVAVVYVSETGETEQQKSQVSADGTTVTAELTHFSLYAVIESPDAAEEDEPAPPAEVSEDTEASGKKGGNGWLLPVVIVAAVLVLGGAAAFLFLKKKK